MVQEEVLQEALEETMQAYPGFRVVMRKGLFWHYLEKSDLVPQVHREDRPPCMKLYVRDKKGLLFEVTYFENRINFEVFHALTDGTGAMEFLKELVKNYLYRVHPDLDASVALRAADITQADKELDGFSHYYSGDLVEGKKEKVHSFQIKGVRAGYGNMKLREGMVSVAELLKKSREYGVTMTVFLTAVFLCAIHREMSPRQEKKPVYLMVPVNLRKFFPSESMLNFFGWIEVGYRFESGVTTFEDVLAHVKQFFKAELTKERVAMRMNALKKYEYNPFLRIAPLEVKNICLQAAAAFSKGNVTAIFSNMGAVQMPEEYAAYIETFDVYTSTPKIELCMCSFQDTAMLSFTSSFENDNIQRNFFRILNEQGLQCTERVPKMPEQKKEERTGILFFKCFSFACLVAAVIAGMVNILYTHRIFQKAESLEKCHVADGLHRGGQSDLGWSHGMEGVGSGFCAAGHLFYHALFGLHHCGRSEIKAPRIYDLFSDGRSVRTDSIYSLAGRRGTDGISIHSLQWMQLLIFGRTRHIQIKGIRCGTP